MVHQNLNEAKVELAVLLSGFHGRRRTFVLSKWLPVGHVERERDPKVKLSHHREASSQLAVTLVMSVGAFIGSEPINCVVVHKTCGEEIKIMDEEEKRYCDHDASSPLSQLTN